MCTPAGQRVPVYRIQQCLGDSLKKVFGSKIRLPQAFTGTEKLVGGGTRNDEVLGEVDTADRVEP
jgi:hypothetical protein